MLALAPLLVAALALVGWCLVDLARHPARFLPRWLWAVLCVASIPLGAILYLLIGRGEPPVDAPTGPTTASRGAATGAAGTEVDERRAGRRPFAADRAAVGPSGRRADGPPVAVTSGLTKRYGDHLALDGIDLCVPDGSIYGLVGRNGAGKTTLLGLLAGLRRPTTGTVDVRIPRERTAVLPDTPWFDPWLTAVEVVDLARALVAPGLPTSASRAALADAGLADVADRRVGGFSRGMLQRLGLAATLVGEPDLLLLDEPCSALDPAGRRDVLDLVGRLAGRATVVFCSHILDDVQEVCDTVGVLGDGRLLFQGPVPDLLVGRASPAYRLRVRGDVGPLVPLLEAEPWVDAVERLGAEEVRIAVRDLPSAEVGLVPLLAARSVPVVRIEPASADLEHVFLELTR
ncbi:MAG: ATP-binding cassette domain-containing protein [Acidimicrobiales bacterium]